MSQDSKPSSGWGPLVYLLLFLLLLPVAKAYVERHSGLPPDEIKQGEALRSLYESKLSPAEEAKQKRAIRSLYEDKGASTPTEQEREQMRRRLYDSDVPSTVSKPAVGLSSGNRSPATRPGSAPSAGVMPPR